MKSLLFFCSPNMGVLDVWVPVLDGLKNKGDVHLAMLFPKAELIDLVDKDNILVEKISRLVDRVVYRTRTGGYADASSLEAALKQNSASLDAKLALLTRNATNKVVRKIMGLLQKLVAFGAKPIANEVFISDMLKSTDAVLYDVTESEKDYCRDLLQQIPDVPKFSLFHGTEIERHLQPKRVNKIFTAASTTAYSYSFKDKEYYQSVLGLSESNVKAIGIPKLQPSWVRTLIDDSKDRLDVTWRDYVVLISRPVGGAFFSAERKRKSVENIKNVVMDELGLKLVVKLHPKESGKELYEEVFTKKLYGKKWIYSNLHPFVLSKNSLFGISFYSGVVTDFLIANRVPCIETLDLKGLKESDNETALRDKNGDPVYTARYNGIVLGGSTYDTLRTQTLRIMKDRDGVIKELTENFKRHYPLLDEPCSIVVNDILKS